MVLTAKRALTMDSLKRKIILITWLFLAMLLVMVNVRPSVAQTGDAWGLIAAVNELRASYGLAPYEVNGALMAAAQAQSEWQAKIGTWSHSGPGGSRPHDRAVAFGYGGGAQVYVSENVAMGLNLTPQKAVYELWQDSVHLETMLSTFYQHIGAGVATSGNVLFYTIVVGTIAGEPGSAPSAPGGGATTPVAGAPVATQLVVQPIQVATPMADGSIIHVVQWGQFLINIADAYGISLRELLTLNGLTEETVIYPGDKLIIRLPTPSTSTPEVPEKDVQSTGATPTQTSTRNSLAKTPTVTPTRTDESTSMRLTQVIEALATLTPRTSIEGTPIGASEVPSSRPDFLLWAAIVLGVSGSVLIGLGTALKRSG